ncbi:DUF4131 domain-containing protein [Brevundimonas sp. DWR2-3-1b1]|uniref:DUF4131 domain-containing protein n=1 Tax=unclassified Brevundimonas TaxID=2622653 RepID=UPI003CE7297F
MDEEVAAQTLRWRLWAPVAFGAGAAVYFALRIEPPLWPLLLGAVVAFAAWIAARRRGWARRLTWPLLMMACVAGGLAAAKVRTEMVAAPIAPVMSEPTVIEAWVVDVDSPGQRGARIVIAPVWIRGLTPEQTPVRLRATVRGEPPRPGEAIRLFGILNPPPAPPAPAPMISAATPSSKVWAVWPSPWVRHGWPISRRPHGGFGWRWP